MEISISNSKANEWEGNSLILGIIEGEEKKTISQFEGLEGINKEAFLDNLNFTGKQGEVESFYIFKPNPLKIILIGLGETKSLILEDLRKATSKAISSVGKNPGKLGINFPWHLFEIESAAKLVAEASILCLFKDCRFQSKSEQDKSTTSIELVGISKDFKHCISEVKAICEGVNLARELVGAPPNKLTPEKLAATALQISNEYKLEIKILEKEDCASKGMGAYLAVAQGSDLPPKFIHLTYTPSKPIKKRIALVGKGLTFDSGGYNLKVGASQIEMMKFDMGGSASVIGAARAIAEIRPKDVEVHFIIASCENMVNGSAVHPGDIVTASNGKTIEINNTDAEGRLTLADALVYASQFNPDAIIDLATLTGACVIALGDEIAGLWSNNNELSEEIINAGGKSGEKFWRMPLHTSYKEGLKSLLADMKNTGPRAGGSITAALFLKEFVPDSTPWAHLDIAGTVWSDKSRGVDPAGATGFGVRTLVNLILGN